MEKIRISGITKKDKLENGSQLVIVSYTKNEQIKNPYEATLNTKWQSQEVNVLENDVGIGGTIDVEIVIKGQYTNITKIDFNSAVKGSAMQPATMGVVDSQQTNTVKPTDNPVSVSNKGSSRDNMIIAQCMLKVEYRNCPSPKPLDIVESYRFYLKELDE